MKVILVKGPRFEQAKAEAAKELAKYVCHVAKKLQKQREIEHKDKKDPSN